MVKTTPLTAQERVILFCTATGVSPWPSRDSSSMIAKAVPMRLRIAYALRSLRSSGMRG
jgi:hypothetical protein